MREPRLWADNGWTARVIKNEDDDGWAVAMTRDGEREPALVGPWTMGRDKKNPKPLDVNAFNTLVKTAAEVIRRHEQAVHAAMHKQFQVATDVGRVLVTLDIVPDEFDPHALLAAQDEFGEQLAQVKVRPDFKLTMASATAWVEAELPPSPERRPRGAAAQPTRSTRHEKQPRFALCRWMKATASSASRRSSAAHVDAFADLARPPSCRPAS